MLRGMALINDPDNLSQGASASAAGVTWGSPTGAVVTLTAGATMPALTAGQYFAIRDHSVAVNNGLYKESGGAPTTSSITATKVSGSNPSASASEAVTFLGSSANPPNIFYDTASRNVYLLEQNGLGFEGVLGQTVYSKMMIDWKDDAFLIANAPFPMLCIDAFAGKYLIGQDASGNNNGWNWKDTSSPAVIRTRKLLRNMGWSELNASGVTLATYAGIKTLGTFEDSTPSTGDLAYYQFGTDTTVDDTLNFAFTGPVNEAVKCFEEIGNPATCTFATSSTITRASGSFITDGYKVGGKVSVRAATQGANNGSWVLTAVAATTLTVSGTPFTTGADSAAQLGPDNTGALSLRLRVRDADAKGKTYSQANLASGGFTALANALFAFPLSNASDQKIDATDATIDGSAPYTGMSLTIHPTPQSLGGGGILVGGPYNFGFTLDANGGTSQQLHEWVQRQLRKTTDIDADASSAIGRAIDGLGSFTGDRYTAGIAGGAFPNNPQGGGAGVYITNLAAVSKNSTTMYDNTGVERGFPIGTPVTLDFNQTLIDDAAAKYTLFFDRTIRSTVSDLVITAGTGADGTFNSAGANLPASLDAGTGAYVRISGLTGGDAAMNGVYQVTALTSTSLWNVTRWDGKTIVTTGSASLSVDQHCIDTPDAIIVDSDVPAPVTGLTTSDFSFTFDYSNNVQGGRTGSTDADVVARAVGQETAQYTQSTIQTIQSATAKTIPLAANIERNFSNP
jgi:hypothetical protein